MVSNMPLVIFDLFSKELAKHFSLPMGKMKTITDMIVLCLSLFCSFFFFHSLVGIGAATVITSACAGTYMHVIKRFLDRHFSYAPLFHWNKQGLQSKPDTEPTVGQKKEMD